MAVISSTRPFAQQALSRPRISASPWLVLVVLALGEFMILLDTTIVNVALPNMATDLHASGDQILWVVNAYTLTFAVLLITAGRLGAMFGPRRLFLLGLLLFTCASGACAVVQSPGQLIVFRVLQATGGAALTPQTLSIITSIFPPNKRGAAFGLWGAIYGLGGISGPTLGGLLTTTFSWRAIFLPNLPIGILALLFAAAMMPELTVRRRHRLDPVGVLLASAGLVAVIFGLVEGQSYAWGRILTVAAIDLGPVHSGLISIPSIFLAGAVLLIAFVRWEARQEEPLLPLSLFRDRNYSLGCVVSAVQVFGMTGLFLPFAIYLQAGLHLTPLQAGFAILPNALGAVAVAPIVGRTADRVNPKWLLVAGLSLYALGMALLVQSASPRASGVTFAAPLLLVGLGVGLTFAPMTALTMQTIAPSASGAASGFMNTVRQVGSSLSAAIGGALLFGHLGTEAHGQAAVSHAFTTAVRPALLLPLFIALGGAALTTLMRSPQRGHAMAPAHGATDEAADQMSLPRFVPMHASATIVLPVSVPSPAQPATPVRAIRPPFLVRVGDPARTAYPIRHALVLGRLPGSGLVVQDPRVSRKHATLICVEGTWVLRDLQSANGTRVNDQPVIGHHPLCEGDVITLGSTSFVFHDDFEIARPRLVRVDEAQRGLYPISKPLTIGRLPSNDVAVDDSKVSRRHARIRMEAGRVYLRDLSTLNGTWVNGKLVVDDQVLEDGDVITLGGATLIYHNDFEAANRPVSIGD